MNKQISSRGFLARSMPLCLLILLSGCASVPADLGRSDVDALLTARGHPVDVANAELLQSLLAAPLRPESAVRIALLNNPTLQASYASLGFGAADVYEAGRIRNPVFSVAVLDSNATGERDQISLGLVASFTDLITLGARQRLSKAAFAALRQQVGAAALDVAAAAQKSYYAYVGAQQIAALRAQVAKAGNLSAALAKRFHEAGNLAARGLAMERAAASEARLSALEADAAVFAARNELATIMGVSVGGNWTAPAALNLPVQTEDELDELLQLAQQSRLDLAAAKTLAEVQADRLGVSDWTRWLGELEVGVERERETDGAKLRGPSASWEIPLFSQRKDISLRARADLQIALYKVMRNANAVDNDVRLANAMVVNARARIDEYRSTLIPQRVATVARAQEQVNFMLIGIFELIALKQEEYDAYQGFLEAIRDYWIARANLGHAVGTTLPTSVRSHDKRIDVEDFLRPQHDGMDHSGGDMPTGGITMPKGEVEPTTPPMDHSGHDMMMDREMMPKEGNGNSADSGAETDDTSKQDKTDHNHGGAQ